MADFSKPPGPPDPSGVPGGVVYGFYDADHKRVGAAVRRVEAELQPAAVGRRGRYPVGGGSAGKRFARTTASIASGAKGSAVLLNWSGTAFSDGTSVQVYNAWTPTIASGKRITVFMQNGTWMIDQADCS